jgi:hypothetical protein
MNREEIPKLLKALIGANSEIEVGKILAGPLGKGLTWKAYGDNTRNYNIVGSQQKWPDYALAEKVVNSIDAQILLECQLRGIDPESPEAPSSPQEAAREFFGLDEERLREMTATERKAIKPSILVVATGSDKRPCITVVDDGEGQHPSVFSDTFLALAKGTSPKDKIACVQGCFLMGGSGVLRFCGEDKYQLIVSRRHPELLGPGQEDCWGYSLIRLHHAKDDPKAYGYYEYFLDEEGRIPTVAPEPLSFLNDDEGSMDPLQYGTVVKMYDYELREPYNVTLELLRDIRRSLFAPVIPFQLVEKREVKDIERASRSRWVMGNRLSAVTSNSLVPATPPLVIEAELGVLGMLTIRAWVFKPRVSKEKRKEDEPTGRHPRDFIVPDEAVFFTINGQAHAAESNNFIRNKTGADLYFLGGQMMVEVDCSDVPGEVKQDIFMSSRDRLAEGPKTERIKKDLASALHENETLKELNLERQRQSQKPSKEMTATVKSIMGKLLKKNPDLMKMLGFLEGIPFTTKVSSKPKKPSKDKFVGAYPPTRLDFMGWDSSKGLLEKQISEAEGSFARVVLETDAVDDYLTRPDGGKLVCDPPDMVKVKQPLKEGGMPIKVVPLNGMKAGDKRTLTFTLTMPEGIHGDDLSVKLLVNVVAASEPKKPGEGSRRKKNKKKEEDKYLPPPIPVYETPPDDEPDAKTWGDFDWGGADVCKTEPFYDDEGKEAGVSVFINMDADCLKNFIRSFRSKEEYDFAKNLYQISVYLHALFYQQSLSNGQREEVLPELMKAVGQLSLAIGYNQEAFRE